MFGHHETAQATVLYAQDVTGTWEDRQHVKIEFVLEVHPANGQAFRAKATHHFIMFTPHPEVGDMVYVKYDPKSQNVELHLHGDNRYGEQGLKHQEQVQRQTAKAQRDALLSAPPGTPLASSGGARRNLSPKTQEARELLAEAQRRLNQVPGGTGMADSADPEMQELLEQAQAFERRATQGMPPTSAGGGALDPELQELMQMEEAERQAKLAGGQQMPGFKQIMPPGVPGMAAPTNPQAAGPAEMQMLRQELEYTGASGQAKILRKQQAGAPQHHLIPFFVEVQVQPDNMGFPFTASFTTWIDTSRGALLEGYTLPVKYDPQNPARIVFLLPA